MENRQGHCITVLQRNRTNGIYTDIQKEIYSVELTHMIMVIGVPWCAVCTQESLSVIQSKSEGLRIKGTEDVKLNIQKMTIMVSGPITAGK